MSTQEELFINNILSQNSEQFSFWLITLWVQQSWIYQFWRKSWQKDYNLCIKLISAWHLICPKFRRPFPFLLFFSWIIVHSIHSKRCIKNTDLAPLWSNLGKFFAELENSGRAQQGEEGVFLVKVAWIVILSLIWLWGVCQEDSVELSAKKSSKACPYHPHWIYSTPCPL